MSNYVTLRCTAVIAFAVLFMPTSVLAEEPPDSMVTGVAFGRDLFNLYREGPKPVPGEDTQLGSIFMRTSVDLFNKPLKNVAEYIIPFNPQLGNRVWTPRIKIAHDQLYLVVPGEGNFHRIPLEDIHLFEYSDLAFRLWKKRTTNHHNLGLPGQSREIWRLMLHPPLYEDKNKDEISDHRLVPYDLWPLENPLWVRAFCIHDGTMFGIDLHWQRTEKDFPKPDDKPWRVGDGRRDLRKVKSNFEGDFTVYRVGEAYYFLADTGKLYMLPDDPKAKELSEVWGDPKRRLLGCIQDVDGKTVYAIVRGEGGKRQWFELSPKPELHDYERTAESLKTHPRRDEIPDAWNAIREYRKKAMQSEK